MIRSPSSQGGNDDPASRRRDSVVRAADRPARQAVFTQSVISHLGGAGTWIAVLLLAKAGAIGNPSAIEAGSGLQAAVALAALIGMGTKAGVMPLHVWLPRAHPLASAPVSALMSGVMIKVAIYALIRVLVDWVGILPLWFGILVLAFGALSAVGGVLYALFQRDLKRLLAFSSVENIGIIFLGIGACLIFRAHGIDGWAAIALGAALLHTLNHAIFKSLLFLAAGVFERAVGSLELDRLSGLLRSMPWTGWAFLVGAMAIAGLPPLNGFASEWLTLQVLLHIPFYSNVADGIAGAIALAALSATAALALFCFVRVIGQVLLGPNRRSVRPTEAPLVMRISLTFLAGACVVLGIVPGLVFGALTELAPWRTTQTTGLSALDIPQTGSLPTVGIAIFMIVFVTGLTLITRRNPSAEKAPTWACGQPIGQQFKWTGAGFTKPVRLMLEVVLRPRRAIERRTEGGVIQSITYSGSVPLLFDEYVYRPAARLALLLATFLRRLQTGRLSTYVAYLIGLLVAVLTFARLGVLQ